METVTAIGSAVLSAFFQGLLDRFTSLDWIKYPQQGQVQAEFKEWEKKLKKLYLELDDAEEKQWVKPLVKMWVSDLRDLVYDLGDVLDELATEVQLREQEAPPRKRMAELPARAGKMKMQKIFSGLGVPTVSPSRILSTFKFNAEIFSKIEGINARLDKIMEEKVKLNLEYFHSGSSQVRAGRRRSSSSLVNEAKIYGREKDKGEVLELLKAEAGNVKVSVIPITGMGGIGKTTLAQLIFKDDTLEFDFRAWVSVGEDFDVLRMTKTILEPENCYKQDLDTVQSKLEEKLSMKKFLIVLDDVWTDNYEHWTQFFGPLEAGASGSKVIVTARNESVSLMTAGTTRAYSLKELSHDDCLSVFAQHALGAKNFDEHKDLKQIGEDIVRRCHGLPLAAKALGGMLRGSPNLDVWGEVLNNNIWDSPYEKNGVLPALRLSYFHLPCHLKKCFAYCAIFPKDYEFDKNELVLLWMAEGFLYQPKNMKPMQDLGCQYFDDLFSRSFFQRSSSNDSRYFMHDLINDLARHISKGICFQLEDENSCEKIRHSSFIRHQFESWQKFECFSSIKSLRTFLPLPIRAQERPYFLSSKVLHDLVPKLKCLRVLSLAGYNLVELPSSIGALKHLRYLDLSHTRIKRLPESVGALLNLQTLLLCGCGELEELFSGIGNLINLQCLDISGTYALNEMPLQIGNLRNLHVLTKFIVGRVNGLKLNELKKFSHLKGSLAITGLQNVMDVRDADFANLKEKQRLEELYLEWGDNDSNGSRNPSTEVQVLNSLQPHQNVSRLLVRSFGGTEFPLWIADPTFTNMVQLRLRMCENVSSLPPLGRLPSLKELEIGGLNGVKEVGAEFYGDDSPFASLETLKFYRLLGWEQWCNEINDVNGQAVKKFPKLRQLYVSNCPKLVGKLPSGNCAPSLQVLSMDRCQPGVLRSASDLTSLTTLNIWNISGFVSLNEAHIEEMVALQDLTITYCDELKYLWKDGTNLDKLVCLKLLNVWGCKQLVSLVEGEEGQLPCNLQVLNIGECDNLEKLPNGLHSLKSLRNLRLWSCGKLLSFPATGVPYGLRNLLIEQCDSLESLPEGIIMHHNKSQLEKLVIGRCKSLRSSPNGEFPHSLQTLEIVDCNWPTQSFESMCNGFSHLSQLKISHCENLSSLPNEMQNLISLDISSCENLRSLPNQMQNLISIYISGCENLRSLPNQMQNFTALKSLKIMKRGGLDFFPEGGLPPNLTSLAILGCENMTQPMSEWGLDRLTSLEEFAIWGTSPSTDMLESFPDGVLLPTSLSYLEIGLFNHLKSISKLTSLREVVIAKCPNLQSFPEEGLPATLEKLEIYGCPLLAERCSMEKRSYWPFISHIPYIMFDDELCWCGGGGDIGYRIPRRTHHWMLGRNDL